MFSITNSYSWSLYKGNRYVLFPAKVQHGKAKITAEAPVQAENAQIKNHAGGTQIALR